MDYGIPDRKKTKNDFKMKRRKRAYKHGGKFRSSTVQETEKK